MMEMFWHRTQQLWLTLKKAVSVMTALAVIFMLYVPPVDAAAGPDGNWQSFAGSQYAGGTGSENDPFQIANESQLALLAQKVNTGTDYKGDYFLLTANLDLSVHQWTPIGISYTDAFDGVFDGGNHLIQGMTIGTSQSPDTTCKFVGLFGFTNADSTVENVATDVQIQSSVQNSSLGGIVGENLGTISKCHVSGNVTEQGANGYTSYVGGLVGYNSGHVASCYSTADVAGKSSSFIGGFVGEDSAKTIEYCYATGKVSGLVSSFIGGFGGDNESATIIACYSTGDVSGNSQSTVSGFVGKYHNGSMKNCFATGKESGESCLTLNGFADGNNDSGGQSASYCYFVKNGEVTYDPDATGLTAAQMQGNAADANMNQLMSLTDENSNAVWAGTANYFPHLKSLEAALKFTQGGDSPVSDITFNPGAVLTAPTAPTRTGYAFGGWKTVDGHTFDFSLPVLQGQTLTGAWTSYNYTVGYHANGGTNDSSNPGGFSFGETGIPLKNPSWPGHAFKGWFTDPSFTSGSQVTSVSDTLFTGVANGATVDLYAEWAANVNPIKYHMNGGTNNHANPDSFTYGGSTVTLQTPTQTGYKFGGWFTDPSFASGSQVSSIDSTQTEGLANGTDIDLYAEWAANANPIKYNLNGGTNDPANPKTFTYGGSPVTLQAPSRTGYAFDGWFTDPSFAAGSQAAAVSNIITGSLTDGDALNLYAKWTAISYNIHFDAQGGTDETSQAVVYNGTVNSLPTPTRDYYHFEGWYTQKNGHGMSYTAGMLYQTAADMTLFANWKADDYPITYILNGGTNSSSNTPVYYYGTGLSLSRPTRDGYVFGGWYKDSSFTQSVSSIGSTQAGAVTLYADWLPKIVTGGSADFDLGNTVLPLGVTSISARVSTEPSSDTEAQNVAALLTHNSTLGSSDNFVLYNLNLLDQSGGAITFTGSVTVRLPVPHGMANPHVYWYDGTTLHDMNATVRDGYLFFTTTHFSYYTVAQPAASTNAAPTDAATPSGNKVGGSVPNPKTGSGGMAVPLAFLIGGSVAGAAVVKRRRFFKVKKQGK